MKRINCFLLIFALGLVLALVSCVDDEPTYAEPQITDNGWECFSRITEEQMLDLIKDIPDLDEKVEASTKKNIPLLLRAFPLHSIIWFNNDNFCVGIDYGIKVGTYTLSENDNTLAINMTRNYGMGMFFLSNVAFNTDNPAQPILILTLDKSVVLEMFRTMPDVDDILVNGVKEALKSSSCKFEIRYKKAKEPEKVIVEFY